MGVSGHVCIHPDYVCFTPTNRHARGIVSLAGQAHNGFQDQLCRLPFSGHFGHGAWFVAQPKSAMIGHL